MAYSIKGKGKFVARKRRHLRLRKKINGTPERPRLVVTRRACEGCRYLRCRLRPRW